MSENGMCPYFSESHWRLPSTLLLKIVLFKRLLNAIPSMATNVKVTGAKPRPVRASIPRATLPRPINTSRVSAILTPARVTARVSSLKKRLFRRWVYSRP